jgi:hypothetical protein
MVQTLIDNNMHEVLINNDQLRHNMSKKLVLQNFQGTVRHSLQYLAIIVNMMTVL